MLDINFLPMVDFPMLSKHLISDSIDWYMYVKEFSYFTPLNYCIFIYFTVINIYLTITNSTMLHYGH